MQVLANLTDDSCGLGGGCAREISRPVGGVLLTSPSARFFSAEKICDEGRPGVDCRQGEILSLDWRGAGGGVETDSGIVYAGTDIMTGNDQSSVRAARQLSLGSKNETSGGLGRSPELGQARVRVQRRKNCH